MRQFTNEGIVRTFDNDVWVDNTHATIAAMGGGSSQPATTTQKTEPWEPQQPYLKQIMSDAQSLYQGGGPQYYDKSTLAAQSPQTQSSIAAEYARGANGSPVMQNADAGASYLTNPASLYANPGNPLFYGAAGEAQRNLGGIASGSQNLNPYLQSQWGAMSNDITNAYQTATAPQVAGSFESAGRYGSGANAMAQGNAERALASQLSTAGSNLLGGAYENMANRQLSAAQQLASAQLGAGQGVSQGYGTAGENMTRALVSAPGLASQDYTDISAMSDAGARADAYRQAQINADIQKWNYGQTAPYQNLGTYQSLVSGNYGGTSTTSQPMYSNQGANIFGGALSGAAAGAPFGPWGAAAGGAVGLLGGLFSK